MIKSIMRQHWIRDLLFFRRVHARATSCLNIVASRQRGMEEVEWYEGNKTNLLA